jgi:hypothetical protein
MSATATPILPDRDVRLVWAPSHAGAGLAGAWWPRTRDASTELRALLPAVTEHLGGGATRVSLNIDAWGNDQPRRLRISDTLVRLGWFHTLDSATITLTRGSGERQVIAVIPSDSDSSVGDELLAHLSRQAHWPDNAEEALRVGGARTEPQEKGA